MSRRVKQGRQTKNLSTASTVLESWGRQCVNFQFRQDSFLPFFSSFSPKSPVHLESLQLCPLDKMEMVAECSFPAPHTPPPSLSLSGHNLPNALLGDLGQE